MVTYFKFPDGIISAWEFQLEMTYTLSTLEASTVKQAMNETYTNPQTIKIHLSYAYYREKIIIQKSWELQETSGTLCLEHLQAFFSPAYNIFRGIGIGVFSSAWLIDNPFSLRTIKDIGDIWINLQAIVNISHLFVSSW